MIRCFIAVDIPDDLLAEIDNYTAQLRPLAPDIRWVRVSGIHITLKFLDEIHEERVEQLRERLIPIRMNYSVFELTARESGFFPSKNNPRVVWIGLNQDTERSLFKIQQWVEDVLEPLNFPREKRRFSPHITIGRIKYPGDYSKLVLHMQENPFPPKSFKVDSVNLMRSRLKPEGAEYSVIESYPLIC